MSYIFSIGIKGWPIVGHTAKYVWEAKRQRGEKSHTSTNFRPNSVPSTGGEHLVIMCTHLLRMHHGLKKKHAFMH